MALVGLGVIQLLAANFSSLFRHDRILLHRLLAKAQRRDGADSLWAAARGRLMASHPCI